MPMPTITPFLWFDGQAEEAMNHYVSIFRNSRVLSVSRFGDKASSVTFELDGQRFLGLNGGPHYTFNEAVSFFISCESQEELDYYWERLLAGGGTESQCGWLKDRFGLSWQVVPTVLSKLVGDQNPRRSKATIDAMLQMRKLVIADLQRAHDAA
jgi:predicted 3-demethylubiquinone-9 3-methyltransferase (glyoxalase superfamily)